MRLYTLMALVPKDAGFLILVFGNTKEISVIMHHVLLHIILDGVILIGMIGISTSLENVKEIVLILLIL